MSKPQTPKTRRVGHPVKPKPVRKFCECDACGYETLCEDYPTTWHEQTFLCDICASTILGNIASGEQSFTAPHVEQMRTVVYCTHLILAALGQVVIATRKKPRKSHAH